METQDNDMAVNTGSGSAETEAGGMDTLPGIPLTPAQAGLLSNEKLIPARYQVRESDNGRFLTCVDAPNLAVRIERGFSVSGAAAHKYPEHTIFLDGAAQGPPFIDSSRKVHNLDHHEGCVRSFTLATCEQAMVMVLKGLDLAGEKWSVFANEPDLDTVVAAWVLLNHRRLTSETSRVCRRVMPLVRLQGVIDAHGFELAQLTGFPRPLQEQTQRFIDRLRDDEVRYREDGSWSEVDPLDYTLKVLTAIDAEVYAPADFDDDAGVEELERIPLVGDRFAVACRAGIGIYEIEQHLRGIHGDRLGLILLDRGSGAWTLRQVDPFLPYGLEALYDRLNLLDPEAEGDNRWGGSAEIGGSPRQTGSGLDLAAISEVCRWVFRPPKMADKAKAMTAGFGVAVGAVGLAAATAASVRGPVSIPGLVASGDRGLVFSLCMVVVVLGVSILAGRRMSSALIGLRRPDTGQWSVLAGAILCTAVVGGGWGAIAGVAGVIDAVAVGWRYAVFLALGVAAAEMLIRGVVHGMVAQTCPIMIPRGRWFLSAPVMLTTAISAALTLILFLPTTVLTAGVPSQMLRWVLWVAAATVMGFACGLLRERSASVVPSVGFHAAGVVAIWVILNILGG